MKTRAHTLRAFTLIELIGVLAIISIMAATLAPNILRQIEWAAVEAEGETMRNLESQLRLYTANQGTLPANATWVNAISSYTDLRPADVATNKRGNPRVLVAEAASNRVLILSSMRQGRSLPALASLTANFQTIWQSPDEEIPFTLGWAGWNRLLNGSGEVIWSDGEYLVVERVNLAGELQLYPFTFYNPNAPTPHGNTGQYLITLASGVPQGSLTNVVPGTSVEDSAPARARVDFFNSVGTLVYTYIVSDRGRNFVFDGTTWVPQ